MGVQSSGNSLAWGAAIQAYPETNQKAEHKLLIQEIWGERCLEQCRSCPCCFAWFLYDQYWALVADTVEAFDEYEEDDNATKT